MYIVKHAKPVMMYNVLSLYDNFLCVLNKVSDGQIENILIFQQCFSLILILDKLVIF